MALCNFYICQHCHFWQIKMQTGLRQRESLPICRENPGICRLSWNAPQSKLRQRTPYRILFYWGQMGKSRKNPQKHKKFYYRFWQGVKTNFGLSNCWDDRTAYRNDMVFDTPYHRNGATNYDLFCKLFYSALFCSVNMHKIGKSGPKHLKNETIKRYLLTILRILQMVT